MRNKIYLLSYIALTALYAGLSLGLQSDPKVLEKYNITQSHAHLVNLAIVIPLLLVWAAALYGFLRFKSYAKTVEGTPEGEAFNHLATGLTVLAYSLPILGSVSLLINYAGWHYPDLLPRLTILKNYINLFFPVVAFLEIFKGADDLTNTLKRRVIFQTSNLALLGTIILTCFYTWLITTRAYGDIGDTAFYLPNWLIICTLVIPYLFIWCKGIQAVIRLNSYRSKTHGLIYKRSLQNLAQGIVTIIILSICIQLISTSTVRLTRLKLTPLLGIVYLLVALYAVGYGMVAQGAKKLKLIEEV